MTEIGDRIKELRLQRNLTQEQLAAEVHVTKQSVSKWETGLSIPDIVTVEKLASFFGTSTDHILSDRSPGESGDIVKIKKRKDPRAINRIFIVIICIMSIALAGAGTAIGLLAHDYADLKDRYSEIADPVTMQNMEVRLSSYDTKNLNGVRSRHVYFNIYNLSDIDRKIDIIEFTARATDNDSNYHPDNFGAVTIEAKTSKTIDVRFSIVNSVTVFDYYFLGQKIGRINW